MKNTQKSLTRKEFDSFVKKAEEYASTPDVQIKRLSGGDWAFIIAEDTHAILESKLTKFTALLFTQYEFIQEMKAYEKTLVIKED